MFIIATTASAASTIDFLSIIQFNYDGLFGIDLAAQTPSFLQLPFAEPNPVHRVDRSLLLEYLHPAFTAVPPTAARGQDMDVLAERIILQAHIGRTFYGNAD